MGAPLPALCNNCGHIFIAPNVFGIEAEGSVDVTLDNVTVGPCPHCSGMGRVPSGVYRLTSDTARLLGSVPADELRALRDLLVHAQESGASAFEVANEITESLPVAATLAHRGSPDLRRSLSGGPPPRPCY